MPGCSFSLSTMVTQQRVSGGDSVSWCGWVVTDLGQPLVKSVFKVSGDTLNRFLSVSGIQLKRQVPLLVKLLCTIVFTPCCGMCAPYIAQPPSSWKLYLLQFHIRSQPFKDLPDILSRESIV